MLTAVSCIDGFVGIGTCISCSVVVVVVLVLVGLVGNATSVDVSGA